MTDEELRQLIESNARSIQGLSQSIADLANQGRQTDARINQLSQRITELTDQGRRTDARLYQLASVVTKLCARR